MALVAAMVVFAAGGCDERMAAESAAAERAGAIRQEASIGSGGSAAGGVTLSQEVSAGSLTVAERLRVHLRLMFDSAGTRGTGQGVHLAPSWPAAMIEIDGLRAIDVDDRGPIVEADGRIVFTRTVIYEPFLPGERTIPPMRVEVGEGEGGEAQTLTLAPVRVEVRAIVEDAPEEAAELAAAIGGSVALVSAPPVAPVSPWAWVRLGVGAAMLAVPLSVLGIAAMRAKRTRLALAPLPALRESLRALGSEREAMGLPSADVLESLQERFAAVLAEELGSGARSLTAVEIGAAIGAGSVPRDWAPEVRDAVATAAKGLETARFHPASVDRASAWIGAVRGLRLFVEELERIRMRRLAEARAGRAGRTSRGRRAAA